MTQAQPLLTETETATRQAALHPDWAVANGALSRRFTFKGFAKPTQLANLAAWLGDKHGHHPDIAFGWGYCTVTFTTHDAGGLTAQDFDLAARLDALTE